MSWPLTDFSALRRQLAARPATVVDFMRQVQEGPLALRLTVVRDLTCPHDAIIPPQARAVWESYAEPAQQAWVVAQREAIGRAGPGRYFPTKRKHQDTRGVFEQWLLHPHGAGELSWADVEAMFADVARKERPSPLQPVPDQGDRSVEPPPIIPDKQLAGPVQAVLRNLMLSDEAKNLTPQQSEGLVARLLKTRMAADIRGAAIDMRMSTLVALGAPCSPSMAKQWAEFALPMPGHPLLEVLPPGPDREAVLRRLWERLPDSWGDDLWRAGLKLRAADVLRMIEEEELPETIEQAVRSNTGMLADSSLADRLQSSRSPRLRRLGALAPDQNIERRTRLVRGADPTAALVATLQLDDAVLAQVKPGPNTQDVVALEVASRLRERAAATPSQLAPWLRIVLKSPNQEVRLLGIALGGDASPPRDLPPREPTASRAAPTRARRA